MAITKEAVQAHVEEQQKVNAGKEQERTEVRKLAIERLNGPTMPVADFKKKVRDYIASFKTSE